MKRGVECLLIVLFSIVCGLLFNFFSPKGIAWVGEWDTDKGVISAGGKSSLVVHDIEIDDITVVKEIFDDGGAVFIDARSESDYDDGHIPGAVSVPLLSFEDNIEKFYETYPTDTPLITYCSGRECQDSHELATFLRDIGYTNVNVFIDGYPVWQDHGFPVESGSEQVG